MPGIYRDTGHLLLFTRQLMQQVSSPQTHTCAASVKTIPRGLALVLLNDDVHDGGIRQGGDVADGAVLSDILEQAAHDLA